MSIKLVAMITRRFMLGAPLAAAAQTSGFPWPAGKRFAVSLSFDDARLSQIDVGQRLLADLKLKATFYVSIPAMLKRLAGWEQMIRDGHEIGNHSFTHPCTGNYRFTRPLEDFSIEEIAADIDRATAEIESQLGVRPKSFAYPCGQKFIGRGRAARSYVPLIADRFQTGRGYYDEMPNVPSVCDMAALMGTHGDGLEFPAWKGILDKAAGEGRWVIFAGHEIGQLGHQITSTETLRAFAAYAGDPANGVWLDTVSAIGSYVATHRA
ncbi:MAG: polysaccharide deacetylase family protein [Bryobacter sp.]|nr:polysaccharide deacetylase family protein [Bryobacter sp. CoA8 C33]